MADLNSLYPIVFLFEAILAVFISVLILSKNPKYYFNQFFAFIVFVFANYFFWESLIYFFYDEELKLLNLFKDISLSASHIASFSFYVTAMILINGKSAFKSNKVTIPGIIAGLSLLASLLDEHVEPITESVNFTRTPGLGHFVTYGVPLIFLLTGMFLYYRQISSLDPETRNKFKSMLFGMILFLLAIIYFATFRFTDLPEMLGPMADIIGSLGYSLGLIFLLNSFR